MLRFNDGVTIKTEGPLRTLRLRDGWYVVGEGYSIPCFDREEAEGVLAEMKQPKLPACKECGDPVLNCTDLCPMCLEEKVEG